VSAPAVSIGLLLPDVLGTYSDAGNAVVLTRRLQWRGIPAEVVTVTAEDTPPRGCDLYLLGGGEDTAQYFAARWLARHPWLPTAMTTTAVTLGVCAGLQLLGRSMTDRDGHEHPGLDALDLTTWAAPGRAVGETLVRCRLPGVGVLTGFVNHGGATVLGEDVTPLGDVEHGHGNDPRGTAEGAVSPAPAADDVVRARPGVVATYLHGPVLARNPALADHLLARVVGHALPDLDPDRVPDLTALRRARVPHGDGRGTGTRRHEGTSPCPAR
jgi:lipid II isoglutaminyl synthase (glutamine-hydrolysing)